MHLLDTDVSLLCSLHSKLEEVDFTNCPCLSDNALLTLSRYQHVEKVNDPLENYKCYPRFAAGNSTVKVIPEVAPGEEIETEEMFLKNNDAAVFEEIQGLALNGTSHYRTWPRLGASADKLRRESSSKVKVEDEKLSNSPYAARRSDLKVASSLSAKKSYAQMTAESLGLKAAPAAPVDFGREKGSTFLVQASQTANVFDQAIPSSASNDKSMAGPLCSQTKKPVELDSTLTFIDWSITTDPSTSIVPLTSRSIGGMENAVDLPSSSSSYSAPSEPLISEIAAANKYHDMYKQFSVNEQEEQSSTAIPALRDRINSSSIQPSGPIHVHASPLLAQVDENGTRYSSVKTTVSDDRMTRTQTSVYYPKNHEETSKWNDTTRKSSGSKSFCIAGATEIKDERVDLTQRANRSAEGFCRTTNHVGVFAVSDLKFRGRSELADVVSITEVPTKGISMEGIGPPGPRVTKNPSQLAICLPGSMVIGGKLRRNKQTSNLTSDSGCAPYCGPEFVQDLGKTVTSDADGSECKRVSGLRAVLVAGCPEITDRGVQALLKGALRSCLSTLDVSRCGGVTNAGLRIPAKSALQQLIAVQMPGISRLVYQLPVQSLLQHLNLAGCYKLEELVLMSTTLKSLNLANCKKLTRLQLKCPSLTALNLSLCDSLERFVSFQCSELQSLNLFGCRMLVQSAMNSAVEVSVALEELRCGGCDRIERLDLMQPSLLTLEVSGSQALRRLYLLMPLKKVWMLLLPKAVEGMEAVDFPTH
ncbi:hypothetical protein AXG93_1024s1100 [Marchantia polymorpha subsp. ruderalis]|uniref:Uncharacterized protein n=1 Tax=Marchantia polymorpha subsp. ruderalis TaxID=1480154 RepID=A0A176VPV8_MARPO|nr:hypothetical protein AXG93_1024s1100 [Marchantia polymorpha subsp. ruderalis]